MIALNEKIKMPNVGISAILIENANSLVNRFGSTNAHKRFVMIPPH